VFLATKYLIRSSGAIILSSRFDASVLRITAACRMFPRNLTGIAAGKEPPALRTNRWNGLREQTRGDGLTFEFKRRHALADLHFISGCEFRRTAESSFSQSSKEATTSQFPRSSNEHALAGY